MNIQRFFILICVFYFFVFLILPHTEYQPADQGIKVLQVKDFIASGYSSFSARYIAQEFDPDLKFFPTREPFAYSISNSMYYVFPFFVTILCTPFYLFGGVYALDFLSLVSGLATIFLVYKTSFLLGISDRFRKPMLIFTSIGSIVSVNSFILGEGIHASLLITTAIFLVLRAKKSSLNGSSFFLTGLLAGLSVLFRIELALFCILLLIGIIFFQMYSNKRDIIFLLCGFAIPACILIYANYKVTGNILGLRGIEFMRYSGNTFTLEKRLLNLFKAFVISDKALGLFTAWPVFLYLIPFFISIRNRNSHPELFFLLFISIIFAISIPVFVQIGDGSILGPRYVNTLQPLFILSVFYSIELLSKTEKFTKWISFLPYIVYYSVFITFVSYIVLFLFLKNSHRMNIELDQKISGEMIILRNADLYITVYPSRFKKPMVAIEKQEDISLFFRNNAGKIPSKLSIISSGTVNGNDSILPQEIPYDLIETFSKSGIVLQNINLK